MHSRGSAERGVPYAARVRRRDEWDSEAGAWVVCMVVALVSAIGFAFVSYYAPEFRPMWLWVAAASVGLVVSVVFVSLGGGGRAGVLFAVLFAVLACAGGSFASSLYVQSEYRKDLVSFGYARVQFDYLNEIGREWQATKSSFDREVVRARWCEARRRSELAGLMPGTEAHFEEVVRPRAVAIADGRLRYEEFVEQWVLDLELDWSRYLRRHLLPQLACAAVAAMMVALLGLRRR